ncbi:MAG: amidohydrolase family protein [Actinomycetota bacterium]
MLETGIVDIWVNLLPPDAIKAFMGQSGFEGIGDFFGGDFGDASGLDVLIAVMDRTGVDVGIMTAGLSAGTEDVLTLADKHPGRLLVSAMVDSPTTPTANVARVRALAQHERFCMVRVSPLVAQYPLNDKLYYPVYAACEELRVPVAINVGIPGPRVRSACQDPVLLEDVLIDFPELVVIGAHMGHPYEALLIQYMLKWPNLYLSTTAYLAKYMDAELVKFMSSSRGLGRVLFGSDHPFLPLPRALDEARALPLSPEAMDAFLGGTARRLLVRES